MKLSKREEREGEGEGEEQIQGQREKMREKSYQEHLEVFVRRDRC